MKLSIAYIADTCSLRLCFLILVLCQAHFSSCEIVSPVMCITGRFTMGSRAFITCLFNRDVNKTKHNFNLVQDSGEGQSGDHVVLCNWRSHELTCNTASDVYFQPPVTDRITVEIENVSEKHAGRYACQILPGENVPVETCVLQLSNRTTDQCVTNEASRPQACDNITEECSQSAAIALAVWLGILLVVIVLVIAYLVRRHGSVRNLFVAVWYSKGKRDPCDGIDESAGRIAAEVGQLLDSPDDSISMIVPQNQSDKTSQRSRAVQTPIVRKWNCSMQTAKKEDFPVENWTAESVREWLMEIGAKKYQKLIGGHITGDQLLHMDHKSMLSKDYKLEAKHAEKLKEEIKMLISANDHRKVAWMSAAQQRREEV